MTRNAELFRKIADQIRREPESHDQDDWGYRDPNTSCGTRACIAGWAVALGDGFFPTDEIDLGAGSYVWRSASGETFYEKDVSSRAIDLLGITPMESVNLFSEEFQPPNDQSFPDYLEAVADGTPIIS